MDIIIWELTNRRFNWMCLLINSHSSPPSNFSTVFCLRLLRFSSLVSSLKIGRSNVSNWFKYATKKDISWTSKYVSCWPFSFCMAQNIKNNEIFEGRTAFMALNYWLHFVNSISLNVQFIFFFLFISAIPIKENTIFGIRDEFSVEKAATSSERRISFTSFHGQCVKPANPLDEQKRPRHDATDRELWFFFSFITLIFIFTNLTFMKFNLHLFFIFFFGFCILFFPLSANDRNKLWININRSVTFPLFSAFLSISF